MDGIKFSLLRTPESFSGSVLKGHAHTHTVLNKKKKQHSLWLSMVAFVMARPEVRGSNGSGNNATNGGVSKRICFVVRVAG